MGLKRAPEIRIDAVWDIETEGWDRFACGCILYSDGSHFISWDENAFATEVISRPGMIWAHNGGRFDVMWLLEWLHCAGIKAQIALAGQRIVRLSLPALHGGKRLELMDSAALIPLSLDTASQIGGNRKQSHGLPCVCGRACGGYCSIKRNARGALKSTIEEYCMQDCRALMSTLEYLKEFAAENRLILAATIGSGAWKCSSTEMNIEPADWQAKKQAKQYYLARSGYYGGRVQAPRTHAREGYHIDINSAYPFALTKAVPCGEKRECHGPDAVLAYMQSMPGVYQCTIDIPEMHLPPLPYRITNRITYPVGKIHGAWALPELQHAESLGCRIVEVTRAMVWSDCQPLLAPWVSRIWDLRHSVGKETALGKWIKLYANSLTGKFAQSPDKEYVVLDPTIEETWCPADFECENGALHGETNYCCPHLCTGKCGCWHPIGASGYTWFRKRWMISSCAHIEFAAYLTAMTRVYLHAQAIDGDPLDICYMDTDSIISTAPRMRNNGTDLGEWLLESLWCNYESKAPKTYRYIIREAVKPKQYPGMIVARCKGIPDARDNWGKLTQGVAIERGVNTFKTAARKGNFFEQKKLLRRVSEPLQTVGDRIILAGGEGHTRPPRFPEDAECFRRKNTSARS